MLGATRGMGRALSRELAARGDSVFLLGRDARALERCAADLEARGAPTPVGHAHCDLLEPDGFDAALDTADAVLGGFDLAVLSAGLFGSQEELEKDTALRRALLTANFVHSIEWCEAARQRLLARSGGTLCAFSSVAGERGRKPVVLYGASKAGLSAYLEGLDHKDHARGLHVVTVKPGFVHTGMTEGLSPPPFAGEPEAVARRVLRAIDRGQPVVYAPGIWAAVMAVIRALPRFLMRRLGF